MNTFLSLIIAFIIHFCLTIQIHDATADNHKENDVGISIIENFDISYIDLPMNGENDNFSSFKIPSRKPWGDKDVDVKTIWYKLRFNPKTMLVHTGDFSYSESTGYVGYLKATNPSKIPYGSAFGCEGEKIADSKARIDLRGTNFAVDDIFVTQGESPAGSIVISHNNQVIDINGGGNCGCTLPYRASLASGESASYGGWFLRLKHIETATFIDITNGFTYIKLINYNDDENFSKYKIPYNKPWGKLDSDVKTIWKSIRYDPISNLIHTGDFTHTETSGYCGDPNLLSPNRIPYGLALGCSGEDDSSASIDLRGTPFVIDDIWIGVNDFSIGGDIFYDNNKIVNINGGGLCGGYIPIKAKNSPYIGGWFIKVNRLKKYPK